MEQAKAVSPCFRLNQVWAIHVSLGGVRMPIDSVTNTTNVLVTGVTLQDLLNVPRIQGRTRHDPVGVTMLIGQPLQPFGLAHRVGRIPAALDMHGFHHVLVAGVRCIVLQEVIPGNGPDVAFQARRQTGSAIKPIVYAAACGNTTVMKAQQTLGSSTCPKAPTPPRAACAATHPSSGGSPF